MSGIVGLINLDGVPIERHAVEVRDILLQKYEVEPDRCECDLLALLEELATEGLIEIKDEIAG